MPADARVCAIQLPGRQARHLEPAYTKVAPLVEALEIAIRPYLDRPYALFGHSMGAFLSFELVRQIRRQGGTAPIHMFVSGCRAPHLPNPDPPIHALPDLEFVDELRRLRGTPEEVLASSELLELVLPTLRSDLQLFETYVYESEEPVEFPVSAFGGVDDEEVSLDEIAAWSELTTGPFSLTLFPGDHFFIESARTLLLEAIALNLM